MSWQDFADENPDLAAFGESRFASRVAYLATVRKDGSPRVHPVTPIIAAGHLFVFMYRSSPKGHDIKRNEQFAMHASVENDDGGEGEFYISGEARLVEDVSLWELAKVNAGYQIIDDYVLFEFSPSEALGTVYHGDEIVRRRWKRQQQ